MQEASTEIALDEKGRIHVVDLTDTEKLTEILIRLRELCDGVEYITAKAGQHPMIKSLLG